MSSQLLCAGLHAALDELSKIDILWVNFEIGLIQIRREQQMVGEIAQLSRMPIDQADQPFLNALKGIHREQSRARHPDGCQRTIESMRQTIEYSGPKLLALPGCLRVGFDGEGPGSL